MANAITTSRATNRSHARRPAALVAALLLGACAPVVLAQTAGAPVGAAAPGPDANPADVPVKRVVLFSSGVGFFEHAGSVTGNGSTRLSFKADQVNDLLKSLVLQDLDGGRASTVTYPSQDPLDKQLRSFGVDVSRNPSLPDLLNQLRGARATIQQAGERTDGTILGVERRLRPVDDGQPVEVPVLNLVTGGGRIVSAPLDSVSAVELQDPVLQQELARALAALAAARDQDKKPVTLNFTGQGQRRVRIGYVVQTPVWKTSYRLILGGDDPAKATVQGWAIVENQTDTDWTDVQLSLVSGRPISFVQDLYRPLYVDRPVVQPELFAGLRPQRYQEGQVVAGRGLANQKVRAAMAPAPAADMAAAGALMERNETGRGTAGMDFDGIDPAASVAAAASAAQLGELFEYTVGNVSLPRQKSAMIPIVADPVEVERVSIYNRGVLREHPLNGVRLRNTTGKHLLGGPVTVLDAGSYAGDAQVGNVPPGQDRLLSYGIDLSTRVVTTNGPDQDRVVGGRIVKGVLTVSRRHVMAQKYEVENKSPRDRTVLIEHPFADDWKLIDTPEPVEKTESVYRFKVAAPAGKPVALAVTQQRTDDEAMAILPLDVDAILVYARTGEIPQPVRDALAAAAQLKGELVDLERQIAQRQQRLAEITNDQNRIRSNLNTSGIGENYRARLARLLDEQETEIGRLNTERDDLHRRLDAQRKKLEDYLGNLTVG